MVGIIGTDKSGSVSAPAATAPLLPKDLKYKDGRWYAPSQNDQMIGCTDTKRYQQGSSGRLCRNPPTNAQ